ncbi:MAG: hypothetical protein CME05_10475 [Gemmatimonadaceae bacterium]|nr:hypothetical protein [Gemmatimonadaceae bacterium]
MSPSLLQRAHKGLLKKRWVQGLSGRWATAITPNRWIFIVGCYNSGTTLLRDLLGRHPQISSLPSEGVRLTDSLPRPETFGWQRMWSRCRDEMQIPVDENTPVLSERIRRQWSFALPPSTECVLEKSIANTTRLPFLQAAFAPASFIYLVRNGYAVAEGIRRKTEPRRHGREEFGDRYPIDLCAEQWRVSHEVVSGDRPGLDRFLQVTYEELTDRPAHVLNEITGFLQLPPLGTETTWDTFHVHGVASPIRNMNAESIARLLPDEVDAIRAEAGPTLEQFGYEPA